MTWYTDHKERDFHWYGLFYADSNDQLKNMTWDITTIITVTVKSTTTITTIKTTITFIPKTIITTDYFSFKLPVAVFSYFLYMTHSLRKHVFVKVKVAYIISFIRRMGIQLSY